MTKCLFCKSTSVKKVQKIPVRWIADLYKSELNVDVISEFKDLVEIDAIQCAKCHLLFFSPTIAGSEIFYENLQQSSKSYYSSVRPEFFEALKFILPTDKVLEIGAGDALFAKLLNNNNYVGLEFNDEAIAKAKLKEITLHKISIEDFSKLELQKFDVVCSFHVLEHVQNPYSFIESSLKTIKKGGFFICAFPCADSYYTKNQNHVLNIPPHHTTRWSKSTIEAICQTFDLTLEYVFHEEIISSMDYFEKKIITILINLVNPKHKILCDPKKLSLISKVVKKINRSFKLYTLFSANDYVGKNILMVAKKN